MSKSPNTASVASGLTAGAYVLAIICLVVGIAIGYLVRGGSVAAPAQSADSHEGHNHPQVQGMGEGQVTPEQLKHMADKQAEPMLEKLKSSPNDPTLLANVGNAYYDARQFKEAIDYYSRSLQNAPNNADVRTDLGTAYYQSGNPDAALAEYDKVLKQNPTHANALVNSGIVKWEAKMDLQGALDSWDKLLKTNPDYPGRADVEQLMARVRAHMNIKPGTQTNKPVKM